MSKGKEEGCDLSISPSKTLIFQSARDQSDRCRLLESRICLFNPSKKMLAFKVKVTSRLRYSVIPWIGLIKGEGEGEISITFRHPFPEDDSAAEEWLMSESEKMKNDGVMICWSSISQIPNNEARLARVWDAMPIRAIRCCILQCELQKMIGIPMRVLKKDLKERLVTQNPIKNCNNNKETNRKEHNKIHHECTSNGDDGFSHVMDKSGDSVDKRLTTSREMQNKSCGRNDVTGSTSYAVVYNECRESNMGSGNAYELKNDLYSKVASQDFTNEFKSKREGRLVPSSRRRLLSRVAVNSVVFAILVVVMTQGLRNLPEVVIRIQKCLFDDDQPTEFFCKYVGLWCEPRDPLCDFIDK